MKLLTVIPYHAGDEKLAANLVKWIGELGCENYRPLLLVADAAVPRESIQILLANARKVFGETRAMTVSVPKERQGWPSGPDFMFLQTCRIVRENFKTPFFWMEPDCLPLKPGWLTSLEAEYEATTRKFMGCVVEQDTEEELPARHLTGCAVYPNDAYDIYAEIPSVVDGSKAWDIAGAGRVLPATCNTRLIQSFWGKKDLPPVFVPNNTPNGAVNEIRFSFIRDDAALFHRDKTHSLIPLLREKLFGVKRKTVPATAKADE